MNIQTTEIKYRDKSWDFFGADTKQYTHCFHSYPAMMIPQVAGKILDNFAQEAKLLFDPYCGTGTSLVEANIRGINAIGTDINPLARLIAKVKTTLIPIDKLDEYLKNFNDFAFSVKMNAIIPVANIPKFKNIDYWFKTETQKVLAIIKQYIEELDHREIRDFFKVAFSETVREVSLTKNSEFKLYRMPKSQMEKFNPDVWTVMWNKLIRNREGMANFIAIKNNNSFARIYDFNTVEGVPSFVEQESVDFVLTSPPYGDSRTTVAYGQFSRLANQWLGLEENNQVDKRSMGGTPTDEIHYFGFDVLDKAISEIAYKDEKRVRDVIAFYVDYQKSINNVSKLIRKNGIVAYVVGNRRVKSVQLPTDEATRFFFEQNGFVHIKTIIRAIPSKRMPKKNSPTNTIGKTSSTMNYEYIVILQKK